jgi:hypothetical protein
MKIQATDPKVKAQAGRVCELIKDHHLLVSDDRFICCLHHFPSAFFPPLSRVEWGMTITVPACMQCPC